MSKITFERIVQAAAARLNATIASMSPGEKVYISPMLYAEVEGKGFEIPAYNVIPFYVNLKPIKGELNYYTIGEV